MHGRYNSRDPELLVIVVGRHLLTACLRALLAEFVLHERYRASARKEAGR